MKEGERIAVCDLGTNSTRLLIAAVDPDAGTLTELVRRTIVTRLGEGVDASGRLSQEATERVHAALAEYARLADAHGAGRRIAKATSAVRDAHNGAGFRDAVRDRHGFEVEVISGDEEARLTHLGATATRRELPRRTLVIDVGGGSTEFVVGPPGAKPSFHVSTRLGSVRQTERHLSADPPAREELEALAAEAAEIVVAEVPASVREGVEAAVAVAGTPTSLAAIDQELDPYDPERVDGYELALPTCERILERLAGLPLAEREQITGLHPERAPTIVAGAAILVAAMRCFGLRRITASETDILHGAALESAQNAG